MNRNEALKQLQLIRVSVSKKCERESGCDPHKHCMECETTATLACITMLEYFISNFK